MWITCVDGYVVPQALQRKLFADARSPAMAALLQPSLDAMRSNPYLAEQSDGIRPVMPQEWRLCVEAMPRALLLLVAYLARGAPRGALLGRLVPHSPGPWAPVTDTRSYKRF